MCLYSNGLVLPPGASKGTGMVGCDMYGWLCFVCCYIDGLVLPPDASKGTGMVGCVLCAYILMS